MREIVQDLEFVAEWENNWAITEMDNTGRRTGLVRKVTVWILDIVKIEVDSHMGLPSKQLEMKVWSTERGQK